MKKLIVALAVLVFVLSGCKNEKHTGFVVLGDYTPYQLFMERNNGKVASITEYNYWAVPQGDSFVKGAKMKASELDSLGFTGDFVAKYDENGDIISCAVFDEDKKTKWQWEIVKENDKPVKANYMEADVLKEFQTLKCDDNGYIIEAVGFKAGNDTVIYKWIMDKTSDTTIYQVYDKTGKPYYKYVFIYNDPGLLMEVQVYKDGEYRGGNEHKYNEMGKASETVFYDKDKKPGSYNYFVYEYDSKGNWIKVIAKTEKDIVVVGEREYTYYE